MFVGGGGTHAQELKAHRVRQKYMARSFSQDKGY